MSTPEIPGDAPAVDPAATPSSVQTRADGYTSTDGITWTPPAVPPTTAEQIAAVDVASGISVDSATTEPTVIDAPDPAVATGDITVALITYRGGTLDGQAGVVSGHDVVSFTTDAGETYTRSDEQHGDFRVYTFTVPEGEPVGGVGVLVAPELENRLQADVAQLDADAAAIDPTTPPEEPAAA